MRLFLKGIIIVTESVAYLVASKVLGFALASAAFSEEECAQITDHMTRTIIGIFR